MIMNESKLLLMKEDYQTRSGLKLKKDGIYAILNPTRDKLITEGKAEVFQPTKKDRKEVSKLINKNTKI